MRVKYALRLYSYYILQITVIYTCYINIMWYKICILCTHFAISYWLYSYWMIYVYYACIYILNISTHCTCFKIYCIIFNVFLTYNITKNMNCLTFRVPHISCYPIGNLFIVYSRLLCIWSAKYCIFFSAQYCFFNQRSILFLISSVL